MEKLNRSLLGMYVRAAAAVKSFAEGERGDTNFISILIILAIVVALAALFLTLGTDIMDKIGKMVMDWIDGVDTTGTGGSW